MLLRLTLLVALVATGPASACRVFWRLFGESKPILLEAPPRKDIAQKQPLLQLSKEDAATVKGNIDAVLDTIAKHYAVGDYRAALEIADTYLPKAVADCGYLWVGANEGFTFRLQDAKTIEPATAAGWFADAAAKSRADEPFRPFPSVKVANFQMLLGNRISPKQMVEFPSSQSKAIAEAQRILVLLAVEESVHVTQHLGTQAGTGPFTSRLLNGPGAAETRKALDEANAKAPMFKEDDALSEADAHARILELFGSANVPTYTSMPSRYHVLPVVRSRVAASEPAAK